MAAINLKVWKQQRNVLHGTLVNSSYAILTVAGMAFKHLCKNGGEYTIDVSDIVRTFGNGATFEVVFYDASGTEMQTDTYTIEVAGNIDPSRQIIPSNANIERLCDAYGVSTQGVILPPSVVFPSLFAPVVLESLDASRIGMQSSDFELFIAGVKQQYTNPIAATIDGGNSIEIMQKSSALNYSFPGLWDSRDKNNITTPYETETGKIVQMSHGSAGGMILFFNRFCSVGGVYHAEYTTTGQAWSFSILIKDAIGGDVDLGGILAPYNVCPECDYKVAFDFTIDGELVHVLNFSAVKSYREPIYSTVARTTNCASRYACVQWVSRTGIRKRATWEVLGVTDEQAEAQELLHIQNAFDVRMGLLQKLMLHIGNLNAYDYWYYSDIVTSPDVRVALVPDDYDAASDTLLDSARVAVVTNSVKQKDGNGGLFSDLNVEIKYKRYDNI